MIISFFVALVASAAANAGVPDDAPLSQLPSGEIVFRDYPERARLAGEQGVVAFRVRAVGGALPTSCEVTRSSGYPRLDKETCELLRLYAYFRPVGNDPLKVVHEGHVRWSLVEGHGQGAAGSAPNSQTQGDTQICKRVPRTGSVAGVDRICRSARAWQKQSEDAAFWQELQGQKGSTSGN